VLVLVWIDFRSLSDALLSLVPVTSGFLVTFGVMAILDIQINPANIIVLPLIFGIGVDAGVHMLHRYRQNPSLRPVGLAAGTGKGVTLTSLTAIIGFGSLLVASHRGIASLGFVLSVGILLTLMACWILMPAALELRSRWWEKRGGDGGRLR
ncbi:MAG: MMPL family transporter, partial [Phycisphaeraceae bacterium]